MVGAFSTERGSGSGDARCFEAGQPAADGVVLQPRFVLFLVEKTARRPGVFPGGRRGRRLVEFSGETRFRSRAPRFVGVDRPAQRLQFSQRPRDGNDGALDGDSGFGLADEIARSGSALRRGFRVLCRPVACLSGRAFSQRRAVRLARIVRVGYRLEPDSPHEINDNADIEYSIEKRNMRRKVLKKICHLVFVVLLLGFAARVGLAKPKYDATLSDDLLLSLYQHDAAETQRLLI